MHTPSIYNKVAHTLCPAPGKAVVCAAFFLAALAMGACKSEPRDEQVALLAAQAYYDQLFLGDFKSFVSASLHGDSVPGSYRAQLELNMRMYLDEMRAEHQGVVSIDTLRCTPGSTPQLMDAFLLLHFADSTSEEIVVPMVKVGEVWYLR